MFTAVAITALIAFAAGVIFHKYVVSEAESVKAHVTELVISAEKSTAAEFESLRSELKTAVENFSKKL